MGELSVCQPDFTGFDAEQIKKFMLKDEQMRIASSKTAIKLTAGLPT
jgi:hypothetical protein